MSQKPSEDWPNHLPFVLQRYWITVHALTGEILLSLIYGSEVCFIPHSRESMKKYYEIQQGSQAWKNKG